MTPDLRIGLYYVMRAFHLGFTEREWGTCRLYTLQSKEHGPNLGYEDIIKLPIDEKELAKLLQDFNAGILPGPKQETPKRSFQPFGWLSPAGEFVEAAFGDHESAAREIIRKMGYDDEQITRLCPTGVLTCRDYLSEMKGYCLIHNPMGDGGYIVSHVKPLTKRQCEYLYGYFMDMGDRFKAEQFLKDV